MEITYPRCIHAEMLRHRVFSRNTASSRAIPIAKVIKQVEENPFIPIHWGAAQGGMQAYAEISEQEKEDALDSWLAARNDAVYHAKDLVLCGLHKQVVNRILEPWVWCTEIISGTQWSNFFHLRCHEAAEPHCQKIAYMIRDALEASVPKVLEDGEWHIPMMDEDERADFTLSEQLAIATGRLARVSYLTHNGVRDSLEDITLHDRLKESGHWSPFEHCAQNRPQNYNLSNFGQGWFQYRKTFSGECK